MRKIYFLPLLFLIVTACSKKSDPEPDVTLDSPTLDLKYNATHQFALTKGARRLRHQLTHGNPVIHWLERFQKTEILPPEKLEKLRSPPPEMGKHCNQKSPFHRRALWQQNQLRTGALPTRRSRQKKKEFYYLKRLKHIFQRRKCQNIRIRLCIGKWKIDIFCLLINYDSGRSNRSS